jgi:AmpD protein
MMRWKKNGWLSGIRCVLSPNQGERPKGTEISLVVLHNISLPPGEFAGQWVEDFFVNRLERTAHPYFAEIADVQVSAHFFLRRSGRLVQFVSTDRRAWHAGRSIWAGRENCNDFSIGIELEGTDEQPYTAEQYEALWSLLDVLRDRYPIAAIAGHCHIAPGRKTDPGACFDWATLRARYPALQLPAEIGFEATDGLA